MSIPLVWFAHLCNSIILLYKLHLPHMFINPLILFLPLFIENIIYYPSTSCTIKMYTQIKEGYHNRDTHFIKSNYYCLNKHIIGNTVCLMREEVISVRYKVNYGFNFSQESARNRFPEARWFSRP